MSPLKDADSSRSVAAFRGVFWSAVNIVVPTAVSLLVFVVTSRLLTPADFGVVALAATIAAAASSIVPSGFGDALVQSMRRDPLYLSSVFWLCLGCGVVAYAVLGASTSVVARIFGAPLLVQLIPVLGIRVIVDAVGVVPTALLTQTLAFRLIALRTAVASIVAAAISIELVLKGLGVWALVASLLATSVVSAIATFWTIRWTPRLVFSTTALRDLKGYGVYASGTKTLLFLWNQADQMIVGFVLGAGQLGIYNFSRRIFSIITDISSGALGAVAHPFFAGIKDDTDRVRSGFLSATFLASVLAFPIFIGLATVADRAIPLIFGYQWAAALWPIRVLCILGVITCIGTLQAGLINSLGKAKWWFYYQLFTGLVNIPIIAICAPRGTILMLSVLVAKTYLFWPVPVVMTLRLLKLSALQYFGQFIAPLAAACFMAFVIYGGRRLLSEHTSPVLNLTCDVLFGLVSYFIFILMFAKERLLKMARILRGFIGRDKKVSAVVKVAG
ncbi:lipopolysaccharide biosynthesis protein [Paraburkholderia fungorum]|uniref:Lipopolysaccharide biosynthesis protein n=2 Tax=Paraburkholderia fungorum TaxID=134537 RepID=A0AAP5Q6Z1_9BURK|nr:lipopolysaccharide biosynthesis protein [Paraburkholderia fungorum]MDT8838253.1 lipopolysaccharide biosynthesis protein [Paraburkholderia fungorum]PRZ51907.1 O-antigen/teichoic acid export membrane protein [Paraburkholderia fungorum]